jgi:hypothetical protein
MRLSTACNKLETARKAIDNLFYFAQSCQWPTAKICQEFGLLQKTDNWQKMPAWAKSVAVENYNTKRDAIYKELTYHAYIFGPQTLVGRWEDASIDQQDKIRLGCPSGIFWKVKTWNRDRTVATYEKTNKISFISSEYIESFIFYNNSNGSIEIKEHLAEY